MASRHFQKDIFNSRCVNADTESADIEIGRIISILIDKEHGRSNYVTSLEIESEGGQVLSQFIAHHDVYGIDTSEKALEASNTAKLLCLILKK